MKPLFDLWGGGIFHLFCPQLWLRVCQAIYAPKITYYKTKLRDTELCKLPFAIHISLFRLPILFTSSQQVNTIIDTNHHHSISR